MKAGFFDRFEAGAGKRNRTSDLLITNQSLYRLSYPGRGAHYRDRGRWGQLFLADWGKSGWIGRPACGTTSVGTRTREGIVAPPADAGGRTRHSIVPGIRIPDRSHKAEKPPDGRLFCFEMAEREGFEPPEPCGSAVFKTAAIDHSAISPQRWFRGANCSGNAGVDGCRQPATG